LVIPLLGGVRGGLFPKNNYRQNGNSNINTKSNFMQLVIPLQGGELHSCKTKIIDKTDILF
jgi:hypothetical protein